MKPLPDLNDDAVIDLAREGGFAFIPKLAAERRIALAGLPLSQKQRVCAILRQAMSLGEPPSANNPAGHGDQFYFRLRISYITAQQTGDIVLLIPESQAPEELKKLWQEGE
ncbi:hypothetical protein PMPD1_3291 [Paramixta manurensis]|uniref:Uncharacterized protein n=1 Tax=Paramixta manurensis TaxID=2740817 RepID=A0A6M8UF55_9GAMM|nr:hypothetical protein PMPD1_3291 [Erwiniaceae bacterium PD-1]